MTGTGFALGNRTGAALSGQLTLAPVQEPPGPHDPDGLVMPALVSACPSFEERWHESISDLPYAEGRGVYIDLGEFAAHLVDLLERDETAEFPMVFATVERLFDDGDAGIRYALSVGLIEAVQNLCSHKDDGWAFAARFRPWLGPATTEAWDALHELWGTSGPG